MGATNRLRVDLTGQTFGQLTVIERDPWSGNGRKPVVHWRCRCGCGEIVSVSSYALKTGHTVSCGCRKVKHREAYKHKTRLYNIWKCMRQRCNNPNNPSYRNYGRRGIKVCKDWDEYITFRDWALASGYTSGLTIDRIDVNGDYCPANCRWATAKEQANNTNRNHFLLYKGERLTMAQVAERMGVSYSTVQHRVERGKPIY